VTKISIGCIALIAFSLGGCDKTAKITVLTQCPEGAALVGAPPPSEYQQRCVKPGSIRHGPSRSWYADGSIRADTNWWDGTKHGEFTLWYDNGQKRAEGEDHHGRAVGEWTYWDEAGNVLQHRKFTDSQELAKE
jgi:hypothetical protein